MKNKHNKGFSLVELIVIIAILAVFAAVLVPSLLQYTENSRAQKDVSAMDEVVNAVQLAMADAECFDEMLRYSCENNFITYSDSSGNYGQQINDGEFWAPDGVGRATTITFNPTQKEGSMPYYDLSLAYVNDMTMDNGSTTTSRVMSGQMISENQCYLKDTRVSDTSNASIIYAFLRQTVGDTVVNQSATYRNSSFTVFIRFVQKDGVTVADVYGAFNGTNLHDGAPSAKGTGTTEYEPETGAPITSVSGGHTTASFGTSDLIGTGTFCPSMTETVIKHNGTIMEDSSYERPGDYLYKDHDGDGDKEWGWTREEEFDTGDEMPEPQTGDVYTYGDYEYRFNEYNDLYIDYWTESVYDEDGNYVGEEIYWDRWIDRYEDESMNGWSVRVLDETKESYGQILTEIAGYPIVSMSSTYALCDNLKDISFVKIPETVTNLSYCFGGCNIGEIPQTFKIPRYVTNAYGLFYYCKQLKTIPKTFTPPTTTSTSNMFAYSGLIEIPSTFVLPDGTTNAEYMFYNCTNLSSIPSNFKFPSSLTNTSHMFYGTKITSIPVSFYTSNVSNASGMFAYCKELKSIEGFTFPETLTNANSMFQGSGITALPNDFVLPENITYTQIIAYCASLSSLPDDFRLIANDKMKSFNNFFSGCVALKSLPNGFTIPNGATSAQYMFNRSGITKLPSSFSIPTTMTSLERIFYGAGALESLPDDFVLPHNATNMRYMFYNCYSLKQLPESFIIHEGIKNTIYAFYGCSNLTGQIKVATTSITNTTSNSSSNGYAYRCFWNTIQPISLVPMSSSANSSCTKLASTDNHNNVGVGLAEINISVINNCPTMVEINLPQKYYAGSIMKLKSKVNNSTLVSFTINGERIIGNTYTFKSTDNVVVIEAVEITDEYVMIESEHNYYAHNQNKVYGEYTYAGANMIRVDLDIQTEYTDYDYVLIYGENGLVYDTDGDERFGGEERKLQTVMVPGSYVKIVFITDVSVNEYYGFTAKIYPIE